MIIALTGFMGCGKSSVASILAGNMGCFYFDLDDTIEMEEGRSIPEIFAEDGEGAFRAMELEYLDRIISDYEDFPTTMILSLGGGTVMTPQCAELIRKNATCVYLKASVAQLVENLNIVGVENRPLLSGSENLEDKVKSMLQAREATYEKCADIILPIDGLSPTEIAERIEQEL